MISFDIPQKLNGTQLLQELSAFGIETKTPLIVDGMLWLDIKSTQKSKAQEVISNHVGIDTPPSIQEKLAEAGIDIDELRTVLGL